VALALGVAFDASLGLTAAVGALAAIASVLGWLAYADRLLDASATEEEPLFPSHE
jgi:hypothetical protein